ncbi:putative serine-rich protein [Aspergillus clavatus NRRL 1]|uniref:Serine-rich protein, putative n=1 Tax=Aspergillus clavatus (strain ATCC 1007 / CBS 513.65 / DSM 816 / NCTC 3887 / NRRL 1 / QM 1276 / 107) TaxID=344612 RepID=A1CM46_ASPCL|nr:serine-rich protein, putative [Aspergillus clavatus NRRL 1]EAW08633.1 serine-rich protein, putative [Aspergillus clavatus NRRL 1]
MPSTGNSTDSSPRRRALHERSLSQTNETSPSPSLRLVRSKDHEQEGHDHYDIYSATPFPTKPEHVLLPRPGKGQEYIHYPESPADDSLDQSTGTLSSNITRAADSSFLDQSVTDPWDLSSTIDAGNTPSQVWEDDPKSSNSSLPEPVLPGEKPAYTGFDDSSVAAYSDEEMMVLPTAAPGIKPVVSETPGPSRQPSGAQHSSSSSSPNVVTIGPPSSPNFVALDSSSLNFVRIGASSNPDSATRSNSLTSLNSMGTVIRHIGAAPWTHGSSEEHFSSRSHSFRSTPPYHPSVRSNSNSTRGRGRSHSRSLTSSSRSGPPSDFQPNVDSGVFIQYPTILAPSSSGSWVDTSQSAGSSEHNNHGLTTDQASDRFKSHLSTVTSRWSAEFESSFASGGDEPSGMSAGEPSRPTTALFRQRPESSALWLISDSDKDEQSDHLSNLPARPGNPAVPSSLSSESRKSSLRSNKRPGTSSSIVYNMLPAWAKMYYSLDGQAVNPALSVIDGSRPPTARPATSNSQALQTIPTAPARTRARTMESVRWISLYDPRDPRSHWLKGPETDARSTTHHRLRHSWSPHLYPDRRVVRRRGSAWAAPSMDSRTEPLLGRRNIQVWSFCFGFVFPIAWFIAAFLPLPDKPSAALDENGPELEMALKVRLHDLERRRYENARWWRKLNRWMTPLGLAIIIIVVTLAAVGTTVGF